MLMLCKICGNQEGNQVYSVKEMMFGTKDEFDYFQCRACGCLQIATPPVDTSRYYSGQYYSFGGENWLKRYLKHRHAQMAVGQPTPVGRLLARRLLPHKVRWIAFAQVAKDTPILDVGCGNGELIIEMSRLGYSNLTGIDPYRQGDEVVSGRYQLLRRELHELEDEFGFIMFHHSFEHLADPQSALAQVHRLLSANGSLLIRIPVADSYAWQHYGVNWYQIDAPRHFFLHTKASMQILARQAGFRITSIQYDSNGKQFWGSERYAQGIPLHGPQARRQTHTRQQKQAFEQQAQELNRTGQADQACFYLAKV